MPANQLYVGTRKGFFTLDRDVSGQWKIVDVSFLGIHVPMLLPDPRDGVVYAVAEDGTRTRNHPFGVILGMNLTIFLTNIF